MTNLAFSGRSLPEGGSLALAATPEHALRTETIEVEV
jgi:hypothetical protein